MSDFVLTEQEQEILWYLQEAQKNNPVHYISAVALVCAANNKELEGFSSEFSRGAFKRAIKKLRSFQKQYPQYAADYEKAIAYIRRNWLHRNEATS